MSAPELSVQLARRALLVGATDPSAATTNVGEARNLSMRAQAVLAAGLVRVGQHASAVEPGFAALDLAEADGARDVAAEVRLDLAACAQEVGEPLLGGALLRPLLEGGHVPSSVRAAALGRLVGCVAHAARRDDIEDALAEADRLLAADEALSPDLRRMERARLAVRSAAYHRWYGDTEDAVVAARDGLNLLSRLRRELRSESDRLRAQLVLELVCALLDEGEVREAENAAIPTVDEPVRATAAASVGRLMLAVATRVYLPSGQVDRGRGLLDQAAWLAERHKLDSVLADAMTEVSRLEEQAGRLSDALSAMRVARAAEQRRMRSVARAARHVLVGVGTAHGARDVSQQAVSSLMRQLAHPAGVPITVATPLQAPTARGALPPPRTSLEPQAPPMAAELAGTIDMDVDTDTDKGTGLLDREGLIRRLRSVRKGEHPVALTLVRFEPSKDGDEDRGPDTGIMAGLADKVRDIAPHNAELARSDGGELAVLLPDTTRDQAEEFAATIRKTAIGSDWLAGPSGRDMSISTGVVQTNPPTTGEDNVDAASMLTAARDALTPAQATTSPASLADTAAALQSALSDDTPTTPLTPGPARPQNTPRSQHQHTTQPRHTAEDRNPGQSLLASQNPVTNLDPIASLNPTGQAPTTGRAHASSQDRNTGQEHTGSEIRAASQDWTAGESRTMSQDRIAGESRTASQDRAAGQNRAVSQDWNAESRAVGQNSTASKASTGENRAAGENRASGQERNTSQERAVSQERTGSENRAASQDPSASQDPVTSQDPTANRNPKRPGEATTGRSILSSLSIESGSGGRRRADSEDEPAPGSKARWPSEPTEAAPRWTRAERRAQESNWPADAVLTSGWPSEPETSRPLRPTAQDPQPPSQPADEIPANDEPTGKRAATPTKPPFSETRHGETTAGISRTHLPDSRHGKLPAGSTDSRSHPTATPVPAGPPLSEDDARHHPADPSAEPSPPRLEEEPNQWAAAQPEPGLARFADESAQRAADDPAEPTGLSRYARMHHESAADALRSATGDNSARETSAPRHTADAPVQPGGLVPFGQEAQHGTGDPEQRRTEPSSGADEAPGRAGRSSYEETKAELARLMSALNAKADPVPETDTHDRRNGVEPRQSIPVPPEPDEVPTPPGSPDIPEPPEPDLIPPGTPVPAPNEPDLIPPGTPAPAPNEPAPPPRQDDDTRSRLMAAFDALTGPVPHSRDTTSAFGTIPNDEDTAGPAPSTWESLQDPTFRAPSRRPVNGGRGEDPEEGGAGRLVFDALSGLVRGDGARARRLGLNPRPDAGGTEEPSPPATTGSGNDKPTSDDPARKPGHASGQEPADRFADNFGAELGRRFGRSDDPGTPPDHGIRADSGTGRDKASGGDKASGDDSGTRSADRFGADRGGETMSDETAKRPGHASGREPGDRLTSEFDGETGSDSGARFSAASTSDAGPGSATKPSEEPAEPVFRADFRDPKNLPSRRPAKSFADLRSAAVVDSPTGDLFGEPAEKPATSSLGAAFGAGNEPPNAPVPNENSVTEPVKETTYDVPIGPERQPPGLPRRGERSSATIASLLTEALAAYQSSTSEDESHRTPERFDSFLGDDGERQQFGVPGRHRSPE